MVMSPGGVGLGVKQARLDEPISEWSQRLGKHEGEHRRSGLERLAGFTWSSVTGGHRLGDV